MSDPERSARASKIMKRRWSEDREKMLAVLARNRVKPARVRKMWCDERAKMMEGAIAKARLARAGKPATGAMAKGPRNYHALAFSLRSPDGEVFRGTNILDFVRTHPEKFDAADLVPKYNSCRAAHGLGLLRPTRSKKVESWKEWTWHYD